MNDAITQLTNKLADLAAHYGPAIADATRTAVRVGGADAIIGGIVCACIAVMTAKLAIWAFRRCKADVEDIGAMIIGGVASVACAIFAIVSACQLFELWNWVAIFSPDVWLVHKALGL